MNEINKRLEFYSEGIDKCLGELDKVLGKFQYLHLQIGTEIELLGEMQGEIGERAEKIAQALDLNRKLPKEETQ